MGGKHHIFMVLHSRKRNERERERDRETERERDRERDKERDSFLFMIYGDRVVGSRRAKS